MEKVVWGIIGAGNVCEIKSAPALSTIPFSEVKTVMRRNAQKAKDYAARHNIRQWTTSLNDVLSDPEINAVYIATPPGSHTEITIRAAAAGKAVYVEKPMANSYAECLTMIEACKKANVPLFVAYYRRTLPGFLKVKEIIKNGDLGTIRLINIEMYQPLQPDLIAKAETNWRVEPAISGGGYFHDLASHQLDFLDFLFGPVIEAKGISGNQAQQYPADDIVSGSFRFANGIIGSGIWCFTTDPASEKDTIKIIGSKGELTLNTFGNPMIINVKSTEHGMLEFVYTYSQPVQEPLIRTIIDNLLGKGLSPSTGESAARTNLVMELITQSAY